MFENVLSNEIFTSRFQLLKNHKNIFIIGLLVRLFFAPWTGHYYDMPIWIDSGIKLANGVSPYTTYIHLGQTILWAIWTAISFIIAFKLFSNNLFVYVFFIKLLPIIVDLLIPIESILLVNSLQGEDISFNKQRVVIIAILLNPYFIIVSSWWAMIDNLAFLLLLISIKLLLNDHVWLPILFTSMSIGLKLYPVIFLPVLSLLLYWISRSFLKAVVFGTSVIITFFVIAYGPFYLFSWNNSQITGVLTSQLTRQLGGVTPFGILTNLTVGNIFSKYFLQIFSIINSIWYLNYVWLAVNISLSFYYLFYYRKLKDLDLSKPQNKLYLFHFIIDMAIIYFVCWYFTGKWVSEQNFIPLLCLLLVKYLLITQDDLSEKKILNIFVILSVFVLLFLSFNAPIFGFFYLVINVHTLEGQLIGFAFIRSVLLIISSIVIIIFNFKTLRDIKHV